MNDKHLFLFTDVLPYELPLIYSNNNLYDFIKSHLHEWNDINVLEKDLVWQHTQPYNYSIWKNDDAKRVLSLLHPLSQLHFLKFVESFDKDIVDHFKVRQIFSIRYPVGINSRERKIPDRFIMRLESLLNDDSEYENNDFKGYIDSFFSHKRFVKITQFYASDTMRSLETKYPILLKLDINNCFYNIYSHSISWAYLGEKRVAKESKKPQKVTHFSALLDRVVQAANWGETHGIVVGPEFSRTVAEIVLTGVDNAVYERLRHKGKVFRKDYEVLRYIDDIFIFSRSIEVAEDVREAYEEVLTEYKLTVNASKVQLENRPFLRKHTWTMQAKRIISQYFDYVKDAIEKDDKISVNKIKDVFGDIKLLLIVHGEQKQYIVSYAMSMFERTVEELLPKGVTRLTSAQVYLVSSILDVSHYLVSYSISARNIIKFINVIQSLLKHSFATESIVVVDLIYKKCFELLKYHQDHHIELLNLILIMKFVNKDLPEDLFLGYLDRAPDYFTFSTILFYVDTPSRRYRYRRVIKLVNNAIQDTLNRLREYYLSNDDLKGLVLDKDLYLVHDFYTNPLISDTIKAGIKTQIIDKISNRITGGNYTSKEHKFIRLFFEFLHGFNHPFMNWEASQNEIVQHAIIKSSISGDSVASS